MSEREKRNLRGPVESLRVEFAELDLLTGEWQPPRHFSVTRFDRDGRVAGEEHHNPDGSVVTAAHLYNPAGQLERIRWTSTDGTVTERRYRYDERGRLVETASVAADGVPRGVEARSYDLSGRAATVRSLSDAPGGRVSYRVEGSDCAYSAPGAVEIIITHDAHDRAVEVVFHDASHQVLRRVVLVRDAAGRVVTEDLLFGSLVPAEFGPALDGATPAEREQLLAELAEAFGPGGMFSSLVNTYDAEGRLIERMNRMGTLSEERTTYHYDELGNVVEEHSDETSARLDGGDGGGVRRVEEPPRRRTVRYEYRYDAHGNWTERVVSVREESNRDFHRSNIERHVLTYYGE